MKYVIGIDLGTGSVKALLVNQEGQVCGEVSKSYSLHHKQPGYSEQDPEDWYEQTINSLHELMQHSNVDPQDIEGISFSGQMHGLVLLDDDGQVLRPAILWNDTRTTQQCRRIMNTLGTKLIKISKNTALEGFTLPKILWVQEHEPEIYHRTSCFLTPKDYLRYRLTGHLHMDVTDAAGTLLLDVARKEWSKDICEAFGIDMKLCPSLVESLDYVGELLPEVTSRTHLSSDTKVFAGGADNACGAVGAGILSNGDALCSIGTSGVILSYDEGIKDLEGRLHFFNHSDPSSYYTMGVTLAAGYSLDWLKKTVAPEESYEHFMSEVSKVSAGSGGLLFTPYLVGERTPHADSMIRGSFIGLDGSHRREHLIRAVMEGITFSLNESLVMLHEMGTEVNRIVSIGGGAKSDVWLQMQADIFQAPVVKLSNEQGPAFGAAMLAAVGSGWFENLHACAERFVKYDRRFEPDPEIANTYQGLFGIYQSIYASTKGLSEQLLLYR
ncbi:xylulokinase [Paenibacillus albiflavus]|uniref:Xylulose kinase n=1 Tax=Paenibacillus albiflavus TaxID=2545760 RepID=A0A4R4E326_9BACL|nr:xylulokinase [Paenibacillus albiflavus]TCZ73809.1 xylulokinase [Paenibacillus albiflavus]